MKGFIKALAVAAIVAATGAQAADLSAPAGYGGYKDAYVSDTWWQPGDVFVRVRAEALIPNTSTSSWNPAIPGANLSVDTIFLPELDLSYFITKNIAVELVCCVDQTTIHAAGTISADGKVGDTWLFPPTLLLQYHFDGFGKLKPYVGAGVNYTAFFDESTSGPFKDLKVSNAWGAAVQVGADYHLFGNWFANVDFKYVWLNTDFSVSAGSRISGHIDVDPILVGAGIGYRFGTGYVPLK
jgi:outer membrane protein